MLETLMFRKPMRLEKWIAFDGALAVDVAETLHDSDSNPDSHSETLSDSGSGADAHESADAASDVEVVAFSGLDPDLYLSPFAANLMASVASNTINVEFDPLNPGPEATLTLPVGFDIPGGIGTDPFAPFFDANIAFTLVPGANVEYLFFEIANPTNGTFSYYTQTEINADWSGNRAALDLSNGDNFAVTTGAQYSNGALMLYMGTANNWGLGHQAPNMMVTSYTKADGETGLRIGIVYTDSYSASELVETAFKSLKFTPSSAGETSGGSFSVGVYYAEHNGLYTDAGKFDDNSSGFFNPTENPPKVVLEDATQECDTDGSISGGGGTPDPEDPVVPPPDPEDPIVPPPDPEDPIIPGPSPEDPVPDPVIPDPVPDPTPTDPIQPSDPVVPGDPGTPGSSSSDGDSGGDNGSDFGGETGEGGGESGGGASDDLVYIYRREDDIQEEVEESDLEGSGTKDGPVDSVVVIDARVVETTVAAAALELVRELEYVYKSVRGDRETLGQALALLREEYLGRNSTEWAGAREVLKQLFDSGNREMEAVNRILDQMRDRMGEFRDFPSARRDGMMTESIRELVDSAARHSGEAGAMSRAIIAVAEHLGDNRRQGTGIPSAEKIEEIFESVHSRELDKWLARAERNDPMGKDWSGVEAKAEAK